MMWSSALTSRKSTRHIEMWSAGAVSASTQSFQPLSASLSPSLGKSPSQIRVEKIAPQARDHRAQDTQHLHPRKGNVIAKRAQDDTTSRRPLALRLQPWINADGKRQAQGPFRVEKELSHQRLASPDVCRRRPRYKPRDSYILQVHGYVPHGKTPAAKKARAQINEKKMRDEDDAVRCTCLSR